MLLLNKLIKIVFTLVLSQMVIFTIFAQSKYEISARDFSFKGMKFGTSLNSFEKKFPKPKISGKTDGMDSYMVEFPSTSPSAALFLFYENKFCQLTLYYTGFTSYQKKMNFIEAMIKKFGKDIKEGPQGLVSWYFPDVDRRISMYTKSFKEDDNGIVVFIEDTKATQKRLQEKNDDIDLGF